MKYPTRGKVLTGTHVTLMLVAFFATILSVNLLMASLATRTFGGTVVDSSYVASQKYNAWLEEARVQADSGWTLEAGLIEGGYFDVKVSRLGEAVTGAVTHVRLEHPLGRTAPLNLTLTESANRDGHYTTSAPLAFGRWHAFVSVSDGDHNIRKKLELVR